MKKNILHWIRRGRIYISYILLDSICMSFFFPNHLRRIFLNMVGHKIQGNLFAGSFMGIGKGRLYLGENSYCNFKCFFDLGDDIIIGKDCAIAFGVTFVNSYHEVGNQCRRAGIGKTQRIIIHDGCWIGANSIILPGVTIGKGCIIGAGTLVTKDCEPDGVYVGCPATRIRDIEQ